MTPEEIALKILAVALEASPVLVDFVRQAIAANPDHPLTKRVEDILPSRSASRAVADELAKPST